MDELLKIPDVRRQMPDLLPYLIEKIIYEQCEDQKNASTYNLQIHIRILELSLASDVWHLASEF